MSLMGFNGCFYRENKGVLTQLCIKLVPPSKDGFSFSKFSKPLKNGKSFRSVPRKIAFQKHIQMINRTAGRI